MSLDVLDDQMITLADLQTKLNEAGLHQHYPKKNNTLLVKKSDIFSKNHDRNIIFLQKGVKCYR